MEYFVFKMIIQFFFLFKVFIEHFVIVFKARILFFVTNFATNHFFDKNFILFCLIVFIIKSFFILLKIIEQAVFTTDTLINVSEIVSFHFIQSSIDNTFWKLFILFLKFRITNIFSIRMIMEIINKLIKFATIIHNIDLSIHNTIFQLDILFRFLAFFR